MILSSISGVYCDKYWTKISVVDGIIVAHCHCEHKQDVHSYNDKKAYQDKLPSNTQTKTKNSCTDATVC